MFEKIKNLFKRKERSVTVECEDPLEAACVLEAFRTGSIIIGNRDENGKVTMTKIPLKEE